MNHLSNEDLVLYYYGERGAIADLEAHLAQCESCRENYAALQTTLNLVDATPVPERGADYGEEVWKRLKPAVGRRRAWRIRPGWAAPLAVAAMVVLAFFVGRFSKAPETGTTAANPAETRQRILAAAVGDHLDRSQMVLIDLLNADPDRPVDVRAEQQRAGDLVAENRLYRQTAQRAGDTALAGVLDELERALLEVARGPSELTPAQLAKFRRRIEGEGLLFKLRVLGTTVRLTEQKAL